MYGVHTESLKRREGRKKNHEWSNWQHGAAYVSVECVVMKF